MQIKNCVESVSRRVVALVACGVMLIPLLMEGAPKRVLFFAGPASHGWGSHQHPAGGLVLVQAMRRSGLDVEIDLILEWPSDEQLSAVDALVIYSDGWDRHPATEHLDQLETFMNRGGGLSVLHWATGIGGKDLWARKRVVTHEPVRVQWRSLMGADFEPWHSVSEFWDADFRQLTQHEVTQGVEPFMIWEECYFHMRCSEHACEHVTPMHLAHPSPNLIRPGVQADSGSEAALTAVKDRGEAQYGSWGFERPQGGRAFGYTGGHLHWNWARDEVRKLVLNGIYWTTGATVPEGGIVSPRPTAREMLANLQGNPGWTEANLQAALDHAGNGRPVKWNAYHGGVLPVLGQRQGHRLEGEVLDTVNVGGGSASPQSMSGFGTGLWSNESQLWWRGAEKGDVLDLTLQVEETARFQIGVGLTKAVDYGQVQFYLDGQAIGVPFDGYHPEGVVHSGELLLGVHALDKGEHQLRLKIVGQHPEAAPGNMVGLDYVALQKHSEMPVSLFDGHTLTGWDGNLDWWRVEDGAIVGEIPADTNLNRNEFLFWDGMLHDFELRLTYRIGGDPSANSGVQIRSDRLPDDGAAGYQADIDDGAMWVGRIYDEHGRALIAERGTRSLIAANGERTQLPFRDASDYRSLVRPNDWNEYVIRAVGPRIQSWINGHPAGDLTDNELGQLDFSGRLAVQLHSGPGPAKIEFKEIIFTDLGKTTEPKAPEVPKRQRAGVSPEGKNLGFESGSFEGWTVTGDAWGSSPVKGDTVTPRRPGQASRHMGEYWVGGYEATHTDAGKGILESAPFEVTHPWASFLVGGGNGTQTRVEVVAADSGHVIHVASGKNVEDMRVEPVDLRRYVNTKIRVRVVDDSSGPWGHLNFDDFRFHKEPLGEVETRLASNVLLQHLKPNPADLTTHPTVAGMWVPDGFQVDLIATEPVVTQPIAFTFDERGRLWIAEAHSYPQRQPEGEGKDRIIILEDQDGDGGFEKKTLFAEGLNLVSGLEVGFGGVWVGAAPQLLFLPDRNQDDVLDGDPEVLLDGWGYQDTHETLNSFTWGPDGWLYGNQGVFNHSFIGKPDAAKEDRIEMRAGVWRYHPQRHEFEIFATGCSNQWGLDFNEMGHMFITHCRSAWGGGPTTFVIQGGHYWNQANAYHAPFVAAGRVAWNPGSEPVFRNFLPASARYGHGEGGAGKPGSREIYGGHSHVGTMIYLGSNWPDEFRNQLFTHNLHGHQMNRQRNVRRGSGYETVHAGSDQLYVSDPQFIGVDLKYGPDGAVYMIDWVDLQHCHTTNVERWDRSNGRLYRMQWAESFRPANVDLRDASTRELIELVTSDDEWFSRMARRLLQERQDGRTGEWVDQALKKTNDPAKTLRLLWTRHATSGLKPPASAYTHESESIRAWAIALASELDAHQPQRLIDMADKDPSGLVRLALASALPRLDTALRWELAERLASQRGDRYDWYLPKMIWFGIASIVTSDVDRAMQLARATPMSVLSDSIVWFLSRDPEGRNGVAEHLTKIENGHSRALKLMTEALDGTASVPAPNGWSDLAVSLRRPETASYLDQLGGIFGDARVMAAMRARLVNADESMPRRFEALQFLKNSGDTECAAELLEVLPDSAFRSQVLPLLARFNDDKVARGILSVLPDLDDESTRTALFTLSSQPRLAQALLRAVGEEQVDRQQLTSFHIRQMGNLGDATVDELMASTWGRVNETEASTQESIDRFAKVYREAPLWAHRAEDGKQWFTLLCASCHALKGEGANIGPDLTGSWRNGADYFLENIVDPNSVVGESYQLNVVTQKDGTIVSGMLEGENAQAVTIRTITERVVLPRSSIESHEVSEQSMMPSGLLDALSEKQFIDIMKFLTTQ